MSDKKFTVSPEHMASLKALMQEEERRLDAADPSDDELTKMELELEQAVRRLSKNAEKSKDQADAPLGISGMSSGMTRPSSDNVIPLRKKPMNWAWVGALAAAAVAVFVVMPRMSQTTVVDDPLFVSKGSSGAQAADCEWKLPGATGLNPSLDGTGYEGKVGTSFALSARCDHDGFISVSVDGPSPQEIRGIAVKAGNTVAIGSGEQLATFVVPEQGLTQFNMIFTRSVLPATQALPRSEAEAQKIEGLLWFDRLVVKEIGK